MLFYTSGINRIAWWDPCGRDSPTFLSDRQDHVATFVGTRCDCHGLSLSLQRERGEAPGNVPFDTAVCMCMWRDLGVQHCMYKEVSQTQSKASADQALCVRSDTPTVYHSRIRNRYTVVNPKLHAD